VETFCAEKNLVHEMTWIRNEVKSGDHAIFEMKSLVILWKVIQKLVLLPA